jgi:cytochrome c-type biogenesis protein CcmE
MQAARRRKLFIILLALAIIGSASFFILYALRQNISLFYTPTQVSMGNAPLQHRIRLGGMVVTGSILRQALEVQFSLTDFQHQVQVHYHGILPDLFREGQGIVAEGIALDAQHFEASQVLAKHDANYMPPELKSMKPKEK